MIINLVGNSIEVKNGSSGSPEYIPLDSVWNVFPIYTAAPTTSPEFFGTGYPDIYPYPTRTQITLSIMDGSNASFRFELQDITAGALVAYNSGTKADLDAATAVINSWL